MLGQCWHMVVRLAYGSVFDVNHRSEGPGQQNQAQACKNVKPESPMGLYECLTVL